MPNKKNLQKSYEFFCYKEKNKERFELKELIDYTGWKMSTVKTYITKKWYWFLKKTNNKFYVEGVSSFKKEEYLRMMSQKDSLSNEPKKPMLPLAVERLVSKARESATLALDIYNRPATLFRTEGYIVMMIIAWSALFHAIFEKRSVSYYHTDSKGKIKKIDAEPKTWELKECINFYFGDNNSPIRKNLEFFIGLRNKIEHRFVPAIDNHVVGECQSLLLNFDELLTDQFTEYYSIEEYLSVPLQTASKRNKDRIEAMKRFQGKQYDEIKEYIDNFRSGLPDSIYTDPKYNFRVFLVPKTGNHKSSSDIAFEFIKYDDIASEDLCEINKQIAVTKERKIPVVNPGKYKPKQVAEIISEKLGEPFTTYNHTSAWKYYKVRESGNNPESCKEKYCQYDEPHGDYIYTKEWIEFLISKLSDKNEYEKIRNYSWNF